MFSRAWGLLVVGVVACSPGQPAAPVVPVVSERPVCRVAQPIEDPQRLPFGFYSVPVDRFDAIADAGVTMVGPYYGEPPQRTLLDAAADRGLGVVYPIGFEAVRSEEDGRADLEAQIDAVADHEAVVAWYVLPEEMRPWAEAELDYLAWVRATVQDRDPESRPLLGYQPNHRRRDELAAASASFDVVTRGLYANFVGAAQRRAWVREGAETIAAARTSSQTAWAVLEMFEQPAATERIADWVRHDVYASLVGGAEGVLVFSGFPRQGFPAYAEYLEAYLDVARELNRGQALATPLLRGVPSDHLQVRIEDGPRTVDIAGWGRPRPVSALAWREVRVEQDVWLYLVNSAEEALTVHIEGRCSPEVVTGPPVDQGTLRLPPLGVAVLRTPV